MLVLTLTLTPTLKSMEKINCVEELDVFKKAHALVLKVYKVVNSFPAEERFGLISQMRRASTSIPANLMEGGHRLNRKEFRQFVGIAKGSTGELKYYLFLAKDLGYIPIEEYNTLKTETEKISKMLNGLANSLSVSV